MLIVVSSPQSENNMYTHVYYIYFYIGCIHIAPSSIEREWESVVPYKHYIFIVNCVNSTLTELALEKNRSFLKVLVLYILLLIHFVGILIQFVCIFVHLFHYLRCMCYIIRPHVHYISVSSVVIYVGNMHSMDKECILLQGVYIYLHSDKFWMSVCICYLNT